VNNMGPLSALAFSGGDWVIYLLYGCSILVVAILIERWRVLRREIAATAALQGAASLLDKGDLKAVAQLAESAPGAAATVLMAGVKNAGAGTESVVEHVAAARVGERKKLEQRLLILGTLGNNAPFIGLFGTVLGVIRAFHDLSESAGGPEVVMKGLSEALVATAVGLLVAIPAVMFYNYFMKRVNDIFTDADVLAGLLLAHLKAGK